MYGDGKAVTCLPVIDITLVNDKPLVDALVAAGVSRGQVILTYAGESAEDAA